jgi:hypothetical protein
MPDDSFIWRFRTCKTIWSARNQTVGCLGHEFVGELTETGHMYFLGWQILSVLITVSVIQVYSFVKTHQSWYVHFIEYKLHFSKMVQKLSDRKSRKNHERTFRYIEMH